MGTSSARLEVVAGNAAGTSIVVDDELVIGRQAEGPGKLADDEEISRSHARVTLDASGFCAIEDLGSTNGTFVNGLRISTAQTLSAGDTIELGATTLVVRELPQQGAAEKPIPGTQATVIAGLPPQAGIPRAPAAVGPPTEAGPPTPAAPFVGPTVPTGPPPPAEPQWPAPPGPAEVESTALEPAPAPTTGGAPPTLGLRVEVDFAAREARFMLDDESEPVRLEFEGGRWRFVPPTG